MVELQNEQELRRLADFLTYQLSVTSNAISGLIAERYHARFGLKIAEWRVMAVLGDIEFATQRLLTSATLMDKVTVNRACKVLRDRGLIERSPNEADGRSHLLSLTKEGRNIHGEVMPLARIIEREIFSVLSENEQDQFRTFLARILQQTQKMGPFET